MKVGESAGTIKSILAAASDYSPASGLTGGLVFNEKYMMEAVEGVRDQVSKRIHALFEDKRFEEITVIALSAIDKRIFEGWAVGYAGRTIDAERLYLKYCPTVDINPANMSAVGVLDFIRDFCALDTLYVQRTGLAEQRMSIPQTPQQRSSPPKQDSGVETIKIGTNRPLSNKPVGNA